TKIVVAHGPQAAIGLDKKAVTGVFGKRSIWNTVASCSNCRDVAGHNLLWLVGVVVSAVAQLARIVETHGPQTAVAFDKQAVVIPCGNRRDIGGHNLLGQVGGVERWKTVSTVAQLAIIVVAHGPQTAVALEKQAVEASSGNLGHGLREGG